MSPGGGAFGFGTVLVAGGLAGAVATVAGGCAAAGCAAFAAREGSTNDAVVSAAASLPCITATAATPTSKPQPRSAAAHDIAGRPEILCPDVTAVPGGSEYCGVMKCAGIDGGIATPGTLADGFGT